MKSFIEIVVFCYFGFYAIYSFVLSVAASFYRKRTFPPSAIFHKIAVLIPGYKEDGVIVSVARDAVQNNYPPDGFDVIIIADSFQQQTLEKLSALPVKVIEVQFEKSTKAKALNTALAVLAEDHYEIAIILDADNIMEKNFLRKVNDAYNAGFRAIQARRTAKNTTNSMAVLDGISEAINNFIFRKGFNALNLSSSLIGSGMAFNFELLKENLQKIDAVGGFDRVLQIRIAEAGYKILYLEDALVYDEKVEHAEVFQNQRKRWLSSQFIYLKKNFIPGLKGLLRLDFNYFTMTIISNIFLPRILMLAIIPVIIIFYAIFNTWLYLGPIHYMVIYALIILSIVLAVPRSFYNRKLVLSVLRLPHVIFIMTKSFLGIRGADKKFIHTPHTSLAEPEEGKI